MKVARHIMIRGLVQGVGYRYFCRREASNMGLTGYVKNMMTGDVEVVAQGEIDLINHFISILKKGPHFSQVDDVNVREIPYDDNYNNFRIEF